VGQDAGAAVLSEYGEFERVRALAAEEQELIADHPAPPQLTGAGEMEVGGEGCSGVRSPGLPAKHAKWREREEGWRVR